MSNPNIQITGVQPVQGQPSTVALTYNAGTNPPLNNNGNVKEKVGQGSATITYTSATDGWTVCGYTGQAPTGWKVQTASNRLVITDPDQTVQQMNFCIQVQNAQGQVYTSTDPLIINEP